MNYLRVRFCCLKLDIVLLQKKEFLTEIFEQHLIIGIFVVVNIRVMSSDLEFLNIELIFADQSSDRASLEDLTIDEADDVHACDNVIAYQSPSDF